jgi:hypothetical protein
LGRREGAVIVRADADMIALLLSAALLQDPPAAQAPVVTAPPSDLVATTPGAGGDAWVGYYEATACAAVALVASERSPADQQDALGAEVLAWTIAAAHLGPDAGRMPEQVDGFDGGKAVAFFRQMADEAPDALAARRTYCQALTPDTRPAAE